MKILMPLLRNNSERYIRILHYKCGCPLVVTRYDKAETEAGLSFTLHADARCPKHDELVILPENMNAH